jgi:ApaG protein
MIAYASTTRDITVTVRPIYLDEPSDLVSQQFAFGYAVSIENTGSEEVQILRRRWIIKESDGKRQDVEGEGEVGGRPVVAPGDRHEYQASCVLNSFGGQVEGNYLVQRPDGERFRVMIPQFPLHAAAN